MNLGVPHGEVNLALRWQRDVWKLAADEGRTMRKRLTLMVVVLLPIFCAERALAVAVVRSYGSQGKERLVMPKYLKSNAPEPAECQKIAKRTVLVEFVIDTSGAPQQIKIERSPEQVRACAVAVVSNLHYEPATKDGVPVELRLHLTLNIGR